MSDPDFLCTDCGGPDQSQQLLVPPGTELPPPRHEKCTKCGEVIVLLWQEGPEVENPDAIGLVTPIRRPKP